MNLSISESDRSLIEMHALFIAFTAIILLIPILTIGLRLLLIVGIYNLLLPLWSLRTGQSEWRDLWLFVFPLSVFQIFPDWFLAAELNTIIFEQDPYIMIGDVPAYMAGLWVIPLFVIVYLGLRADDRHGRGSSLILVSAASLMVFLTAEATLWILPAWKAQNVSTIAHVAIYIVLPETLLGISTFLGYLTVQGKQIIHKIAVAFMVMIFYLGNASFFYFIIERLLLGT